MKGHAGPDLLPISSWRVSLNLTVGILGELSLGHAGFMSVGAFTGVVVATMLCQSAIAAGPRAPDRSPW